MATIRDSVSALYTSIYDEFLLGAYADYPEGCSAAFKEENTTQKDFKVDDLSSLGMWEDQDELVGGNIEDPVVGYEKTYTIAKTTKQFQVSFEASDDDEYALLSKVSSAEQMGRGGRARQAYDQAQHLYLGFSVAGPDGQYTFSAAHPQNREVTGNTYSNLLSGAFSHDNLEAAEKSITDNAYDMKAIPIPITEDPVLLYPPALRGKVARVLSDRATEQPDTTMRNINQFTTRKGMFTYKPVEDVWLNAANDGSDTAWYIMLPGLGYFKFVWRQKPHFVSWIDYNIEAYNFKGRARYDVGNDNWRGGWASTGV